MNPVESVRLDRDRLNALYVQLGESGAEDVVCRAIEELAVRLAHCERCWRQDHIAELRKNARSLIAISEQIGMCEIAQVAADVTATIDNGDDVARAATLFRLIRLGDRSLTAVWNLRDLSL
ncbi:hypothetical protein [Sedimentitalea todarodis]|uniref:HPt domain-containing protein n=1 Tax=Sedimentitalea todarodis TaxID=1631240 RepID=A0ABU3VAG9_9RHOB|nr:hypothetical protein [Sedimentitalea todarodis]MDU9003169.1 hypothetical protein [Sedimentitalea todarodis]